MSFLDRLFKRRKNDTPPSAVTRTAEGTVVVDLRRQPASSLRAGSVFEAVGPRIKSVGAPSQMLVWVIPVAVFEVPEDGARFVKGLSEQPRLQTDQGSPVALSAVLAGSGPGSAALTYLIKSLGMTVFAIEPDGAPPIVEARTTGGSVVRGMTGKLL